MKKFLLVAVIVAIAVLAITYGTKSDGVVSSQEIFEVEHGEGVTFSHDMTWFKVGFEARQFEQDPNSPRQPGFTYVFVVSKLDSADEALEFNFKVPGKERFTWKSQAFELEFLGVTDDDEGAARVTKI